MEVKPTDNPDIFECQSESNPSVWYEVNIVSGSCSCPHYKNRLIKTGGTCKHYTEVMNFLKKSEKPIPKIEFKTGDDVEEFVSKYGEGVLTQLKRNFEVIERHGRLIKI